MAEPYFFIPWDGVQARKNRLPHWQQDGGIYFVTFRLADSLPEELLRVWQQEREVWLKRNPPPHEDSADIEYHRLFTTRMEQWLDKGSGSCALRAPEAAAVVAGALGFYEGRRSRMTAFVVMPNHVHVLFGLEGGAEIQEVVGAWKGHTSYTLARQAGVEWPGWQKDYFDRLVRDEGHFARCVRYIRKNPVRAELSEREFLLWEGERARAVE